MLNYTISISVVTFNNERHIEQLLKSIDEHVHGVDYHIFIVDNGSTDATLDIINNCSNERITLIRNSANMGFGKGHNQALPLLTSRYHVVVNPDIIVKNDVITDIARYLDTHENIGIITPKVLYPNGELQILPKRNPKLIYLLARRINIPFLRKYRDAYEMAEKDADDTFDIEFCTGSFMFIRTELFKKVGGFDERFFMYFEDADLTRRILQEARAQYNPNFTVYHRWERAGSKKLKYFLIQVISMIKYMMKWR